MAGQTVLHKAITPNGAPGHTAQVPAPRAKSIDAATANDTPLHREAEKAELLAKMKRHLADARAIERRATDAGRNPTDAEIQELNRHIADWDALQVRFDSLVSEKQYDDALQERQAVSAKGFGAPPGTITEVTGLFDGSGTYGGPQSKATRGGQWGAAVVRESSDLVGRFKTLVPAGSVLVDVPAAEPVAMGRAVNSLRSVIPAERSSGVYAFLRQTLRDHNAAVVPAGELKPTSIYEFERVQRSVVTVAHLSTALNRADVSDAPLLTTFLDQEMRHGLETALEAEIISGDGTGEHFLGLANTPGVQTVASLGATPLHVITGLRRGLTRLETYGLTGTAYVMSPSDWEYVEMSPTDDGALLLQGANQNVPIDSATRRLFGVPVVTTIACPVGTAYVADFTGSTKLWVREEANLTWSESTWDPTAAGGDGASDFQTNRLRFRVEGRFGFAVTRPTGIVEIALA
jgi:HK97 family phage major capsid protein